MTRNKQEESLESSSLLEQRAGEVYTAVSSLSAESPFKVLLTVEKGTLTQAIQYSLVDHHNEIVAEHLALQEAARKPRKGPETGMLFTGSYGADEKFVGFQLGLAIGQGAEAYVYECIPRPASLIFPYPIVAKVMRKDSEGVVDQAVRPDGRGYFSLLIDHSKDNPPVLPRFVRSFVHDAYPSADSQTARYDAMIMEKLGDANLEDRIDSGQFTTASETIRKILPMLGMLEKEWELRPFCDYKTRDIRFGVDSTGNEYFRLVELGGLAELSRIGESPEYWTPNGLSNLTRLIMEATTGIRFSHESTLYSSKPDINEDIAFFNLSNNPKWDSLDATTQYLFLKGLGRMHDDKYKTFQEFTSDLRAYYTIMTTGKFPKTSDGTDYQGSSSQAKAALMVAKNQNDSASESALKASLRRRYYHEASKTEDQVREEKAQNSLRTAESMIKLIDKPGCGSAPKLVLLEEYLIYLSCEKEQNEREYWATASLAVGSLGKILIGLPDTTDASVKEALYNWCGSMVQIIPNENISEYSHRQRSTILLEEEKLPELDQLISIYLASHQQGDTPSQETIETVVGIKTEQLLAQMKARVAQLEADKAALAKQNAELAVQLAEKVTPAKKNEKVIGVAELTLAERLERTEQFHAKVAEVLGISAREINAEVFKILRINPDIDPQEAIGLARTNALVKRGLDVVVPGKPSYPAETFARFAGAVGLWGLKAGNRGEYNKAVATLKQAGINVVDNNWLDPGDDRWY